MTVFLCCLGLSYFYYKIACSSGLNCDQMEPPHEEQYSEYSVERNPRAYMSIRDYRNLPWKNRQPVERNPNPNRSMRDYRNPPCAPSYMVPPTNAPYGNAFNPSWGNQTNSSWEPRPPQYAPRPHSQSTSPMDQAILNLTNLVGNFVEERKKFNAQLSQIIHTVETSLNQKLDGLQSEMDNKLDNLQSEIDQKFDNLQCSISKLASQLLEKCSKENRH